MCILYLSGVLYWFFLCRVGNQGNKGKYGINGGYCCYCQVGYFYLLDKVNKCCYCY